MLYGLYARSSVYMVSSDLNKEMFSVQHSKSYMCKKLQTDTARKKNKTTQNKQLHSCTCGDAVLCAH